MTRIESIDKRRAKFFARRQLTREDYRRRRWDLSLGSLLRAIAMRARREIDVRAFGESDRRFPRVLLPVTRFLASYLPGITPPPDSSRALLGA